MPETLLIGQKSQSCGCLTRDTLSARNASHGLTDHPLYAKWKAMRHRCSSGNRQYKDYAGRGIGVCDRWQDPAVFIADIEGSIGPCPNGMSLDRINNDGNYEPGNVRWATHSEQMLNRTISRPG